jgi:hypothetical protein
MATLLVDDGLSGPPAGEACALEIGGRPRDKQTMTA